VLALELRQYLGQDLKTLVPRIIGQTAEAEQRKSAQSREQKLWDEPSFFEELERRVGPKDCDPARTLLDWAKSRMDIWWGKGKRSGSFGGKYLKNGIRYDIFQCYTYGSVEIHFQWLKNNPPFDDEEKRKALLERLNAIPSVDISSDAVTKRPSIPLQVLRSEQAIKQFIAAFDWVIEQIDQDHG